MLFMTWNLSFGLNYGDRVVTDCDLVTNSKSKVMALNTLLEEAARTGLCINWKKKKDILVQPKFDIYNSNYFVAGNQSEVFDHFTYFGSIISSDGCIDHEAVVHVPLALCCHR